MRRFRMRFGRNRLAGGENDDGSVLPTRNGGNTENEASCCYCDLKITKFNEPISRLGRRFSGAMKIWFSIGLGFGVASLFLVTLFLLLQFHPKPLSNRLASAVFGFSPSTVCSLIQNPNFDEKKAKSYFLFAACVALGLRLCVCFNSYYCFSS